MRSPGDGPDPAARSRTPSGSADGQNAGRPQRRGSVTAFAAAATVSLLAAAGWAVLRGIFELGTGTLVVSLSGGWGIGVAWRGTRGAAWAAGATAAGAWLTGLVLTWLLAMAILPGSSRTLLERVQGTPFLDWLSPQFGLLEVASLVLWVGTAAYTARSSADMRS